ncbi:MAG: site-2 protease family protein [Gemmatimonadales bacterium]
MHDAAGFYAGWHSIVLAGGREVSDGIVRPEHRGPSPDLAAFLRRWPGAWYWGDNQRTRLVLIRGTAPARPERWLWHGALLVLFIICTLGAGMIVAGRLRSPVHPGLGGAVTGAVEFAEFVIGGGWRTLAAGGEFALPLLGILLVHELGHYFAARRYAIDVSPPYFLPVPPNLSPIGSLGAFIRLRSPVYDRRQLLDVGAAGPLAGFVVALGVLLWGYQLSQRLGGSAVGAPSLIVLAGHPVVLGESLLTHALRDWLVPGTGPVLLAPAAFAGWVGMFITGLNLLPLSQLDGGHICYGLVGKRQRLLAVAAGVGLVLLGTSVTVWLIWAALTFMIGGGKWSHPDVVISERPVLRGGLITGLACAVVLVLTFVPHPFR